MGAYDENDIVVSGIGGHFPGCDTLEELQSNLLGGVDMVTADRARWDPGELNVPVRTGKMKSLDRCDAQYFGLVGKQCHALDPITRKVLERTYEAVFDAGLNPSDLSGSKTGVFFGSSILETEMSLMEDKTSTAYNILGRNKTMNANRISYWLDLKGPSFTLDSTWSSGLQAFALGFQYLRSGLCEAAIVAAGSSVIHPEFSKHFLDLNMLSSDGTSRPFDEAANGFARSEAVVVVVLQKAKDAKRNYGFVVHAIGKSVNTFADHIVIPRERDWFRLYEEFYAECRVDPSRVTYLEADGMACQEADSAEMNAAAEFFCREREASEPLLVGSVKSNLGHTLAAGGLCALAKVLIANQTGVIPPNLHYSSPNKSVAGFLSGKMKVVSTPTALPGEFLAVNDFGFGGTYGHCLIRRPEMPKTREKSAENVVPRLVLVSGRHEEGIDATIDKVESNPLSDEYIKLVHDVFSRNISHHMFRGYTIVSKGSPFVRDRDSYQGAKRPVWFVFSGMGSHWATMGRDLADLPMFKESIDKCHKILLPRGVDLWDILTRDDEKLFDNILNSFVAISSVQTALVDILFALGIRPDGIIGHSAGELGAAYADGCLDREEMILSSYSRGKVSLEVKVIRGMMAAIGKGHAEMKDNLPPDVEVACHNSPTSCTISGPCDVVANFVQKLNKEGVFAKAVNVSNIAFHSKHIKDLGPRLREELLKVIKNPKRRSSKWVSSSVPESKWDELDWQYCSAEYLTNNLLSPVYFEEACKHIPKNAIVIEIAPHGLLLSILKRSLGSDCINVSLTHRNAPNQVVHLLQSIGKLYVAGLQPKVSALYPPVPVPVSLGTPFLGSLATWDHSYSWNSEPAPRIGSNKGGKDFVLDLDDGSLCKSYKLESEHALPFSVPLRLVLEVFSSSLKKDVWETGFVFDEVVFRKPVPLKRSRSITLTVMTLLGTGNFEVLSNGEVFVTGNVQQMVAKSGGDSPPRYLDNVRRPELAVDEDEVYSELVRSGHEYLSALRIIKKMTKEGDAWEYSVNLDGPDALTRLLESVIQSQLVASCHPERLDELVRIRHIALEPYFLPKGGDMSITLNALTAVAYAPGIHVKGLKFASTPRAPLALKHGAPTPRRFCSDAENDIEISFVETFPSRVKPRQSAYSATDRSNVRLMGVGHFDDVALSMHPDPILRWKIPEKWSADEAATVPVSYCLAYYMLKILVDVKERDAVLVTNGSDSIGLASVAVALQYTKDVYVIVRSEEDEDRVRRTFTQLGDVVIVTEKGREHLINIQLERICKTKKVDYIVNTDSGTLIDNFLVCMLPFAHFFQVVLGEPEEDFRIRAMDSLVNYGSIHGITLRNILTAFDEDKTNLRELVSRGIENGVVRPLPRQPANGGEGKLEFFPVERASDSDEVVDNPEKSSYLVVGDVHSSLLTAEWLLKRKAKNVTVVHPNKKLSAKTTARIECHAREGAPLVVKHADFDDENVANRIFQRRDNVDVAIILPVDRDDGDDDDDFSARILESISSERLLSPRSQLVAVLKSTSRGVDLCRERARRGFPTLAILWDGRANGKSGRFLHLLDQLLRRKNGESVVEVSEDASEKKEEGTSLDELLDSFPKCEREIVEYGETIPDDVEVTEVRTLSPPLESATETIPVFLLRGIKRGESLSDKFRSSFYPTFKIELPHFGTSSIEELASYAIPKMKSITRGPYIVIGEQWGGCVALELSRQLESQGCRVHTFLLSGTPHETVDALAPVGGSREDLEVNLLSRLLHITDPEVLQDVSNEKTWSDKTRLCSRYFESERKLEVLKGLDVIKSRLEAIVNYSVRNPLRGPLTVITKQNISSAHLKQLCNERVSVHEVGAGEDILNDDIFKMIHDTAIHRSLKRPEGMAFPTRSEFF